MAVFLLVLGTNRIDRHYFKNAENALVTMYEDRVVAQDYIYQMSLLNQLKKEYYQQRASNTKIIAATTRIDSLIKLLEDTRLTIRETTHLRDLKSTFSKIQEAELNYFKKKNINVLNAVSTAPLARVLPLEYLTELQQDLNRLAAIQVSESKNITYTARKSLSMNSIISSVEIGILITIAILLVVIIFKKKKKVPA